MAGAWAANCVYKIGQANPDVSTWPFNPVGQIIFTVAGTIFDLRKLVEQWYAQGQYYNDRTNTCESGKSCGLFTQVINIKLVIQIN